MENPPIYTSEPMATRALAAEIRHAPDMFVDLVTERTGVPLAGFKYVRCEKNIDGKLDVLLGFSEPESTMGIEAKFDHQITRDQVHKHLTRVDHLVVLLPAAEAAPTWLDGLHRVSVMTWNEALDCFPSSRLTVADITSMPLNKTAVEASLRALHVEDSFPEDWYIDVERGGSGMPSITVRSPELPNGRELRAQLQVAGQGMPPAGEDLRFEYYIGVEVRDDDADLPNPEQPHEEPGWFAPLRRLRDEVLDGKGERFRISFAAARPASGDRGSFKLPLAARYLPGESWLVKGYLDWEFGIKSDGVPASDLEELRDVMVDILQRWYSAEMRA